MRQMRLARHRPAQGDKVGMSVRAERHRLAVDQGIVDGQGAHRLRDPWKPVVEQGAAATPHLDALALLSGEDPEAVMLHFMQPARPGRAGGEDRLTRLDEAGRRGAPRTPRRDTPQHAPVCKRRRRRSQRSDRIIRGLIHPPDQPIPARVADRRSARVAGRPSSRKALSASSTTERPRSRVAAKSSAIRLSIRPAPRLTP